MVKKKLPPPSGGTPATQTLSRAGVPFTLHMFENPARHASHAESTGYGMAAAEALGVEPERVFKTLVVALQGSPHLHAVAIVPVTRQVGLKALAHALSAKRADIVDAPTAERITGYVVGGISPLGQRRSLPTVIDGSARTWDTIYVSAGRRGADIEVQPEDLIRLLTATVAEIGERSWT